MRQKFTATVGRKKAKRFHKNRGLYYSWIELDCDGFGEAVIKYSKTLDNLDLQYGDVIEFMALPTEEISAGRPILSNPTQIKVTTTRS